jgi:hypothetical protein
MSHHVEVFMEDGSHAWGWQCFTCQSERSGFLTVGDAERGADKHLAAANG